MTQPPAFDDVWADAQAQLADLTQRRRFRSLSIKRDDTGLLNFSSNDYLGLGRDPRVMAAAAEAARRYGAGAGASRLVDGNLPLHEELEHELANFKGTQSSLVFSSGYLANLGTIEALSHRADGTRVPVFFDRLAHASLVDAARLLPRYRTFPHNNIDALREQLERLHPTPWPAALVVTEGVFSMDGDLAPLSELAVLCAKHRALLIIDDAHGTGTVGPQGRGSAALAGISAMPHVVQTGTLSKALGSQGGFAAGVETLRHLLINRARPFIFETGLAPAAAAAALESLKIIQNEPELVKRLHHNQQACAAALHLPPPASPILPVILGSEEAAVNASDKLRQQGILAVAIRPPSVPPGTSRIRFTVSARHTAEDIQHLEKAWKLLT